MPDDPAAENPAALERQAPAAVASKPKTAIGLIPENVDQAWRLAGIMAASELVPKNYKDKPSDVLVAIMYGAELGLTPAQAITGISVINGRPGLFAEALLAVIVSSPLYLDHAEYYVVAGKRRDELTGDDLKQPTTAALCSFWRRGRLEPFTSQFSVADAQRAHLIFQKAGPWIEYPQIMLKMRARGFAARDAFPDLLRGVRTAEELRDTPAEGEASSAPVVRRISDALARELEPAPVKPAAPVIRELAYTLEPARVEAVAPFLDQALLTTSSGARIVVPELADAAALGALAGSDRLVALTVQRGPTDELVLQSFAIQ